MVGTSEMTISMAPRPNRATLSIGVLLHSDGSPLRSLLTPGSGSSIFHPSNIIGCDLTPYLRLFLSVHRDLRGTFTPEGRFRCFIPRFHASFRSSVIFGISKKKSHRLCARWPFALEVRYGSACERTLVSARVGGLGAAHGARLDLLGMDNRGLFVGFFHEFLVSLARS